MPSYFPFIYIAGSQILKGMGLLGAILEDQMVHFAGELAGWHDKADEVRR